MNKTLIRLLKIMFLLPILPIIGIPGEGDGGSGANGDQGGGSGGDGKPAGDNKSNGDGQKPPEKTHTQADVDKAVSDRLAREKKKYEKMVDDLKKQLGGDSGNAGQAGTDGQQGTNNTDANAQAAAQAQALITAANQRLVQAAAITEAVKLGVDPKYTADAVKLADLSKIEVKEDGTMDTGAISKALDEVIKRVPVFKMNVDTAGGFKIGGEGQQQQSNNNGWTNPAAGQNTKRWNRFK